MSDGGVENPTMNTYPLHQLGSTMPKNHAFEKKTHHNLSLMLRPLTLLFHERDGGFPMKKKGCQE